MSPVCRGRNYHVWLVLTAVPFLLLFFGRVVASTVSAFSPGISTSAQAFTDMEPLDEAFLESTTYGEPLSLFQSASSGNKLTLFTVGAMPCSLGKYAQASSATCVLWYVVREVLEAWTLCLPLLMQPMCVHTFIMDGSELSSMFPCR